jgi:hypothetical protein
LVHEIAKIKVPTIKIDGAIKIKRLPICPEAFLGRYRAELTDILLLRPRCAF